jgi:hypothetical protein
MVIALAIVSGLGVSLLAWLGTKFPGRERPFRIALVAYTLVMGTLWYWYAFSPEPEDRASHKNIRDESPRPDCKPVPKAPPSVDLDKKLNQLQSRSVDVLSKLRNDEKVMGLEPTPRKRTLPVGTYVLIIKNADQPNAAINDIVLRELLNKGVQAEAPSLNKSVLRFPTLTRSTADMIEQMINDSKGTASVEENSD